MLCNRGCGKEAIYFSEHKQEWVCHKVPAKCKVIAEKIGNSRKELFEADPYRHNGWGRVLSEETKRKIGEKGSVTRTGRKHTESHRQNISRGLEGRIVTEETKEKIRLSNLEHWEQIEREPWNKGKKGLQVAWNKGKKKVELPEILSREDPCYSDFGKYRHRVGTLTNRIYKLYKEEINPNNYPRGKSGILGMYQLDHIISVREGFEKNMSIEEISRKENLQMIPWLDNVLKYDGKGKR